MGCPAALDTKRENVEKGCFALRGINRIFVCRRMGSSIPLSDSMILFGKVIAHHTPHTFVRNIFRGSAESPRYTSPWPH